MLQNPKFPFVVAAIGGLCMMAWMFSPDTDEEPERRVRSVSGSASGAVVTLCHEHVLSRVAGTGVTADIPAFMDGARGVEHLGGTAYSFRSHVDLIDGRNVNRLEYYCAVEDGAVVAFQGNE